MTPFDSLRQEDLCPKKVLRGPWPSAGFPGNPRANPMPVISPLTSGLPIPPHPLQRSLPPCPFRRPPQTMGCGSGTLLQTCKPPLFTEPWMSLQACRVQPNSHQGNKVRQPPLWEGKALLFAVMWVSRTLNITNLYCWLVGFIFMYVSFFILKIVFKSCIPNWPLCLQKEKWKWIWNPEACLRRISVELFNLGY